MFAPTNAAFLSIGVGPDNVDDVAPSVLEKLLLYHILPGSVPRESIARHAALYTSLGVNLETSGATLVDSEGTAVSLLGPDVAASNGYLHYVDGVLMPPDLMTSLSTYNEPGGSYEGVFDTLIEGLRVTDMWGDFKGLEGPFTVRFGLLFFFASFFRMSWCVRVRHAGFVFVFVSFSFLLLFLSPDRFIRSPFRAGRPVRIFACVRRCVTALQVAS